MATLRSLFKSAARDLRSTTIFTRHSRTRQHRHPHPDARKSRRSSISQPTTQFLLQSMTPPIDIENNHAPEFIHSLVQNPFRETLTAEDLSNRRDVELYALSYRHEPHFKAHTISLKTLRAATDIIRSHAAGLGRRYYSIWIDALFNPLLAHPTITSPDRGLLPYTLFYVVAVPSEQGFEKDLTRAWLRCEHQLAANSRGLLVHPSQEPPRWTDACHEKDGKGFRRMYGACLQPSCSLYALASGICFGMLEGAVTANQEDLHDLYRWGVMLLFGRWSEKYLYSFPDSTREKDRENRVRTMLNNTADLFVGWKKDWQMIIENIPMIQVEGRRRRWDGAKELLHSLSRNVRLSEALGIDEELHAEIRRRSKGFLVTCTNGQEVGLYVCYWKAEGAPIAMLVDVVAEEDGSRSIVGYRVIHEYCVRMAFRRFLGGGMDVGGVVCKRDSCDFMEILTAGLLQVGYVVGDVMAVADCRLWFVGMK